MSEHSKIEWTDTTWNPVLGCDKVSAGCKGCYAIRTAWRLQHNPNPKVAKAFEGLTKIEGGKPNWTGRVNFVPDRLYEPLHWNKPRRIFVNSQSDLFHDSVTDAQIDSVLGVIAMSGEHTFQVLTKRPERMKRYFARFGDSIEGWVEALEDVRDEDDFPRWNDEAGCRIANAINGHLGEQFNVGWPMRNLWLGVSCEDQPTADKRIPQLLQTPAAVRWISAEPLLGPIHLGFHDEEFGFDVSYLKPLTVGDPVIPALDWVVAGGESGPDAHPMHPDWARSLRDQCKAAGVPFFFKQWGEWVDADCAGYPELSDKAVDSSMRSLIATDGSRWNKVTIPHDKREGARIMMRVGKKAAGRKLDGVEHSEYPGGERA